MKNQLIGCKAIMLMAVLFLLAGCGKRGGAHKILKAEAFQEELATYAQNGQLIDVRTEEEFAQGHLAGAKNINYNSNDFKERISDLDRNAPVFVYCLGGGRSNATAEELAGMGFTQVYDLKGGIMAWKNKNLPIEGGNIEKTADRVTMDDLHNVLRKNKITLVDFYADWCVPCKEMEPTLEKLAKDYKDKVFIYRINVDEATLLSETLKIEGIPLFHVYKGDKLVRELTGFQEEEDLKTVIDAI
ncbi:redoxin domain-containing protein [Olivibacter sp. SDN3]|uniref:thioredoxin domain-containing protein n=1 Tax=Olivibacter sp. SDN3 TaxID=2764720 RepID=UPI0016514AF9|nr:thioredoxin domain-containing protein [Olivibacter sp. SDN3]QNL50416.1 redoxin domain-containing protein [Olivibacter sp. SDN3]